MMKSCNSVNGGLLLRPQFSAVLVGIAILHTWTAAIQAGAFFVPNNSFESPVVPPAPPYASPEISDWQKSAQPAWYDPSQNANTPWAYLFGEFFNVPFPGQFIDNCDGSQAAFIFALPEAALFQDDHSSATNTAFNAKFGAGNAYDLTVGVIGGGGGMKPGVTLQLSLYYRDAASNQVTVASTSITNSATLFPTNTHFVDFQVHVPTVKNTDPWAGHALGIQLLSTVSLELAGGYWDVDNVRLTETPTPALTLSNPVATNTQFSFAILSDPGVQFEIQAATNLPTLSNAWVSLGKFTNLTGVTSFRDNSTNFHQHYYRARQF
jgi:hypothetical protein